MEPRHPRLTSHADARDSWRRDRLVRTDGRVREVMRMLTGEPELGVAALGEVIWARHVTALHDDHGVLTVSVTHALADSAWLAVVAAVLARAWDGEDESEVVFVAPDGRRLELSRVLAPPRGSDLLLQPL